MLRRGLVITAVAGILLVPWTIRNFDDFHTFIPTTSGLGQTLWEGLGELPNDFGATWKPAVTNADVHRVQRSVRIESPAYDKILARWGIDAVEQHPLFYLKLLAFRTAQLVWLYEPEWMSSGAMTPFAYKPGLLAFAVDRPIDLIEDALNPTIVILAILTLLLTWRRWRQEHAILIATVLAVLVPYIMLLVQPRYVMPAEFAYFIWIGLGIDMLSERVRRHWGMHGVPSPLMIPPSPLRVGGPCDDELSM